MGTGTARLRVKAAGARAREDFGRFLHMESAGAVVLLLATMVALIAANSPLYHSWEAFWSSTAGMNVGAWTLSMSLEHWVSDGLMAIFFFVVGLEIKREVLVGELSKPRQAMLPILAAIGGMAVPAALYFAINAGGGGVHGWGVPMATDIAFTLGVLSLLGSKVPTSLKVFLTALAIADDLGAVLVIAIFYSSGVHIVWLGVAAIVVVGLVLMARAGVDSPVPYALLGLVVWFCFLNSGVHATLAGILVALTIPATARLTPLAFTRLARARLEAIDVADVTDAHVLENDGQQRAALKVAAEARLCAAPLQRLELGLHPVSTFVVLPLFALANAGVHVVAFGNALLSAPAIGVVVGLVLGKPIGIVGMTWVATRFGLRLPQGVTWRHLIGAGALAGIGFTVSLFVAGLAFRNQALVIDAKVGVLTASLIAGAVGYALLVGGKAEADRDVLDRDTTP